VSERGPSFQITENARKAFLYTVLLTPILVLASGAMQNQQADNILPAFFSTDNLNWFYWDQSRYGSIHSFLAFPIQNIRWNLILHVHLRAASLIFLVVWIVNSCNQRYEKEDKSSLQYFFAYTFAIIFLVTFQEAGDALIYGANAHPIAIPFALLAISFKTATHKGRIPFLTALSMLLWAVVFWGIAIWTSIFTALWAPALILLQFAYYSRDENILQRKYAVWLSLHICVVGIWSWIFSQIAKGGGENTSFAFGSFLSQALERTYIRTPLSLYLVLIVIAALITIFFSRNWTSIFALISTVFFIGSVPVIAASTHVQAYSYMPRYFGVQYISALLVLALLFGGWIRLPRVGGFIRVVSARSRQMIIFSILISISSLSISALSDVEFGTGKMDASGFVNTGYGIPPELEKNLLENMGDEMHFAAGSYWYVWPAVFDLRSRGSDVIAITKKATHQKRFSLLYNSSPIQGLCIGESTRCWDATINAQLNGSQLFSEIDSVVIGNLADGTPIRRMWVSKYPIKKIER